MDPTRASADAYNSTLREDAGDRLPLYEGEVDVICKLLVNNLSVSILIDS